MHLFETYKYPIVGGVLGLILAILLILFGFFKTILALLLVTLGILGGLYCQRTGLLDSFIRNLKG
ncbi:DUF2273 domain-containing protein [Streptococcus cameli]